MQDKKQGMFRSEADKHVSGAESLRKDAPIVCAREGSTKYVVVRRVKQLREKSVTPALISPSFAGKWSPAIVAQKMGFDVDQAAAVIRACREYDGLVAALMAAEEASEAAIATECAAGGKTYAHREEYSRRWKISDALQAKAVALRRAAIERSRTP